MGTRTKKVAAPQATAEGPPSPPSPSAPTLLATYLRDIACQIKVLEKRTISSVVEIGRLLHEASKPEVCPHGEYQDWLKREFGWSYQTALNYRNAYELVANPPADPQKPNSWVFDTIGDLNISISALYLVASLKCESSQPVRLAIIEAAKVGRVTFQIARQIITAHYEANPERFEIAPGLVLKVGKAPAGEVLSSPEAPAPVLSSDGLKSDGISEEMYWHLAKSIHELVDITADDPAWPAIIDDIGAARLLDVIKMLQTVYAAHCEPVVPGPRLSGSGKRTLN